MKLVVAIALFFFVGCTAARPAVQFSGIPAGPRRVEDRAMPARPDSEPLPDDVNYAEPLLEGDKAPRDGILLSPEKVARFVAIDNGYNQIFGLYESDRVTWQQQRVYYEETIDQANKEIVRLSPTWWDENKFEVGLVGGFIVGVGVTLGIVYGVDQLTN